MGDFSDFYPPAVAEIDESADYNWTGLHTFAKGGGAAVVIKSNTPNADLSGQVTLNVDDLDGNNFGTFGLNSGADNRVRVVTNAPADGFGISVRKEDETGWFEWQFNRDGRTKFPAGTIEINGWFTNTLASNAMVLGKSTATKNDIVLRPDINDNQNAFMMLAGGGAACTGDLKFDTNSDGSSGFGVRLMQTKQTSHSWGNDFVQGLGANSLDTLTDTGIRAYGTSSTGGPSGATGGLVINTKPFSEHNTATQLFQGWGASRGLHYRSMGGGVWDAWVKVATTTAIESAANELINQLEAHDPTLSINRAAVIAALEV